MKINKSEILRKLLRSYFSMQIKMGKNKVFYLIDLNGKTSLTNDCERVLAYINSFNKIRNNDRVFYKDSLGIWDEIITQNGAFKGFAAISASDMARYFAARSQEKFPELSEFYPKNVGKLIGYYGNAPYIDMINSGKVTLLNNSTYGKCEKVNAGII